jgi:hypothetical protein
MLIRDVDEDLDEYYVVQGDSLSTMADHNYVALFANNLEQIQLTLDECMVKKSFKVERGKKGPRCDLGNSR